MILTYDGNRFELIATTDLTKMEKTGFTKDRQGAWVTQRPEVAKQFIQFADLSAKLIIRRMESRILYSQGVDCDEFIPAPKNFTYLGFQKVGILFAYQRERTLIADEMRLGKTVQFIGLINYDKSIESVLVLTRASLKINWFREVQKWLVTGHSVSIVPPGTDIIPSTDIVITNYDNMKKLRKAIDKRKWSLVGGDECHYLANPNTQRTRFTLGEEWRGVEKRPPIKSDRLVLLSGTPFDKKPKKLWPIVRVCDREVLGKNQRIFEKRYCSGWEAPWGWDAEGASHLSELNDRLRSSFMIRRLRKEVLDYLPKERRQLIPISSEGVKNLIEREKALFVNNPAVIEAKRAAEISQRKGDNETFIKAVRELRRLTELSFERTAEISHLTSVAKIPYVVEAIEDTLEEIHKVVIFAHHQDVIATLLEKLKKYNAVAHYGRNKAAQNQASIDTFTDDVKCRVFIGSITGAEGYSVAVASYSLFAEFVWSGAKMKQAEDRLILIEKFDSILHQYLVFDESLDADMARQYVESEEITGKALDRDE